MGGHVIKGYGFVMRLGRSRWWLMNLINLKVSSNLDNSMIFCVSTGHINNAAPWRHTYCKKIFFTKAGEQQKQEQRNGAKSWGTYTWRQSYQAAVGIVHR